ncbi:MAG: hypothetical protein AAFV90_24440 [Cyanobacteria bacterium J06634_5]
MSTTVNLVNYASNNRSAFSCGLWLALQLLLSAGFLLSRPAAAQSESPEFSQLQQTLENHGFTITLALPPQRGSYGLLQVSTRTIWVNPVVFDLEIAVPTLVHEAVHAAQLCNGARSGTADTPMPLNLGLTPYAGAYRLYTRYTGTRRTLETEAYTIQARADRVEYVTHLLNSRC